MHDLQYILNRLPIGLIMLDKDYRVVSYNDITAQVLGADNIAASIGKTIQSIHPKPSRDKINWLLEQAKEKGSSGFVSMLINVSNMVLQLRMTQMLQGDETGGYCMLCYDITDLISASEIEGEEDALRPFNKLPVSQEGRIALLDVEDICALQADGHYTNVHTSDKSLFCNLSLAQLETRLPADQFMRVHRSYIINIQKTSGVRHQGDQLVLLMTGEPEREIPVSRNNAPRLRKLLGV